MIEKSPDARYDTARAAAEDLRRYINDLPIFAKRPGPVIRAVKFARRHKTAVVSAGAAILLVLAAGLLVKNEIDTRKRQVSNWIKEAKQLKREHRWIKTQNALESALGMEPENVDALIVLRRRRESSSTTPVIERF